MLIIVITFTLVAADEGGHDHGHVSAQERRSIPHGYLAVKDAVDKLDKQFLYLLSSIAGTLATLNKYDLEEVGDRIMVTLLRS